jgi:uncharacterized protein (TIGR00304 family)
MGVTGVLFSIGMLLSLIGFSLTMIGTIWGANRERGKEETIRAGGLVMIGPIPIVFGSDSNLSRFLLKIALGFTIIIFLLTLFSSIF